MVAELVSELMTWRCTNVDLATWLIFYVSEFHDVSDVHDVLDKRPKFFFQDFWLDLCEPSWNSRM